MGVSLGPFFQAMKKYAFLTNYSDTLLKKPSNFAGDSSLSSDGAIMDAKAHDRTGARLAFYMQLRIDQPGACGHPLQAVRVSGPCGGHIEASSVIADDQLDASFGVG